MTHKPGELSYFISEKKGILVVSLIGSLSRSNMAMLDKCGKEIGQHDFRWVIINLRDVPNHIEKPLYPMLVRIQQSIRSKPALLWISGLHPELRKTLVDSGLVRPSELTNNLAEALENVQVMLSQQQAA